MNYQVVIESMVSFNPELPRSERSRVVGIALREASPQLKKDHVIKSLSKAENTYLRRSKQKFYLLTSLSINNQLRNETRTTGGALYRITYPRNISSENWDHLTDLCRENFRVKPNLPANNIWVKVSAEGRSSHEAADRALRGLDLMRSLINFGNHRNQTFRFSHDRNPVNKVVLGPVQGVFDSNGSAVSHGYYEPEYDPRIIVQNGAKRLQSLFLFHKNVYGQIRRHNLRSIIEDILIRYVRALDIHDLQNCFLRLWGVLETLTNTNVYDNLIKRTVSIYISSDQPYIRQELKVMQTLRNAQTHHGQDVPHIEALVFSLKRHVETVLEVLIGSSYRFSDLEEFGQFLDLPARDTLRRRKQLFEYAIRFKS